MRFLLLKRAMHSIYMQSKWSETPPIYNIFVRGETSECVLYWRKCNAMLLSLCLLAWFLLFEIHCVYIYFFFAFSFSFTFFSPSFFRGSYSSSHTVFVRLIPDFQFTFQVFTPTHLLFKILSVSYERMECKWEIKSHKVKFSCIDSRYKVDIQGGLYWCWFVSEIVFDNEPIIRYGMSKYQLNLLI